MCACKIVFIFLIVRSAVASTKKYFSKNTEDSVVDKVIMECLDSDERLPCLSEKTAIAIERSMNWDIPIFEGFRLLRNEEKVNTRTSKSLSGFNRLNNALFDFVNTHKIYIDLSKLGRSSRAEGRKVDREGGGEGGEGGGGGGGDSAGGGLFSVDKKDLMKEQKYYRYAFMVLLGIFGLTGPLVMKILGIVAAHSLLAAKAALIIVGGVALKKIFEKDDHKKPKIKVHTVDSHDSEEDYDRMGYSYNHIPYGYSGSTNHPYSAYYASNDFAPVMYGTPYDSKTASKSR